MVAEGLRLLLAGSYDKVGVKDIVDSASVPKGSFYYYFESKEAFGEAVVDRYAQLAEEEREQVLGRAEGGPVARVRAYFEHLAAGYRNRQFVEGCLFGNLALEMSDQSDRLRTRVDAGLRNWEAALARLLEGADSLPSGATGEEIARHLVQSWEGALVRMRSEKSERPLELFFRFAFDRVLPAA